MSDEVKWCKAKIIEFEEHIYNTSMDVRFLNRDIDKLFSQWDDNIARDIDTRHIRPSKEAVDDLVKYSRELVSVSYTSIGEIQNVYNNVLELNGSIDSMYKQLEESESERSLSAVYTAKVLEYSEASNVKCDASNDIYVRVIELLS